MLTVTQAMRRAGSTALRDMRSEAKKRIRERKMLRGSAAAKVLKISRPAHLGPDMMAEWRLDVRGGTTHVSDYPGYRQIGKRGPGEHNRSGTRKAGPTRPGGVVVQINRGGGRSFIPGGFVATMPSGHTGVFVRDPSKTMKGSKRQSISERLGSRPVDALLHPNEAQNIAQRGRR